MGRTVRSARIGKYPRLPQTGIQNRFSVLTESPDSGHLHWHIGYVYSRTDKGSTLREAILEEMVMKKEPLLEHVTYPNQFLFDLSEEYRKQEDYCAEEWESDKSDDDGILFVQLKERLSRLDKILRLDSEEEDDEESEGEGDADGSNEDGTQSEGEDGSADMGENEDAQMVDEDEDCGLEEFEKKFLGEILRMIVEVGALQSIFYRYSANLLPKSKAIIG